MTKVSKRGGVWLLGAIVIALGAACGSSEVTPPAKACIPGQTLACVGANGCASGQACKSDGSGYEACVCGSTPPVDASVPDSAPACSYGTFAAKVDYATGTNPYDVAVGDFNGDNKPDLAVTNYNSNTVSVLLGTGNGTFAAKADYATGSGPFGVAVGDFNGDTKLDLAMTNKGNTVSVLLGAGNGTFAAKVDYATGSGPFGVAVGDFNGDNKPDLAVANVNSNTVSVLLNQCK